MIKSFKTQGTRDIFNGKSTSDARRTCPSTLWEVAVRKLDMLHAAVVLDDLKIPPGNRLEKLKGDRSGQYSIRINDQYRICFTWTEEPENVELIDYHK
jgi:proteic killer suppression protein